MRNTYVEYSDDLKLLSVIEDSILDEINKTPNTRAMITANNYNGIIVIGGEINCNKDFDINNIVLNACKRLNIEEGSISVNSVRTIDLIGNSDVYEDSIFASYGYSYDYNELLIPNHEFMAKEIINFYKGKTVKVTMILSEDNIQMIGIESPDKSVAGEKERLIEKLNLNGYYISFNTVKAINKIRTNKFSGQLTNKRFGNYLCRYIANHITTSTYAKKCQVSILNNNGEESLYIKTFGTEIVNMESIYNRVMDLFNININNYKKEFKGKLVDTNFNYEALPYEIVDKLDGFTLI